MIAFPFDSRMRAFLLVGGTCYLLNLLSLYLLTEKLGLHYLASVMVAFLLINCCGFVLNRRYTFADSSDTFWRGLGKYNLVLLSSCLWVLLLMYVLVDLFRVGYLPANIAITTGTTFYNFFLHKKWTFGKKASG